MIYDGGILFGGLRLIHLQFGQSFMVFNIANGAVMRNITISSVKIISTFLNKYAHFTDSVLSAGRNARFFSLNNQWSTIASRGAVDPGSVRITKGHELFLFTDNNGTYISNDELATISFFNTSGYVQYDLAPTHMIGCKSDGSGGFDVYRKPLSGTEEFIDNVTFSATPSIRVHHAGFYLFFEGNDLVVFNNLTASHFTITGLMDICFDQSGTIYAVRQSGSDVICSKSNGTSFDDIYTTEGNWGAGNKLKVQDGLIYLILEDRLEIVDAVNKSLRVSFDAPGFSTFKNAYVLDI